MQPIATALFLLGYGLALPILSRLGRVIRNQQRLAFNGHQLGIIVATLGWASRSSVLIVAAHLLWLAGSSSLFWWVGRRIARRANQGHAVPR